LSFQQLEGAHTGANIATRVFDVLDQYNVANKLFCITTDNASNNKKCMRKLSKMLRKRKGISWDHKAKHISCLNHVINIAVQAFLKKCKVLDSRDFDPSTREDSDDNADESDIEGSDSDDEDNDDSDDDQEDMFDGEDESDSRVDTAGDMDQEVLKVAQSFQTIIWKFREIAKVCDCSIQFGKFNHKELLFVCYITPLSEMS